MIIGIVAVSRELAIGRGGKLPWHYSTDLKFFKQTTMGHAVAMGSKTWGSIGKPLPGRENIVLTRSDDLELPDGVHRFGSVKEVLDFDDKFARDVFVIGGAGVYASFADVIDRWVVTEIPESVADADTFMPRNFLDDFDLSDTIELDDHLLVKILHRRRS